MLNFFTISLLLLPLTLLAQEAPKVPAYGKLLLLEERQLERHFEYGIEGGIALDNSSEDVYSLGVLGNYVFSPIFSLGLEISFNKTKEKDLLKKLKESDNVKVTSFTPDWFSQAVLRVSAIKGHLNLFNRWHSPFEMNAIFGGGIGYNDEQSKSSSLISWGGELLVPFGDSYKAALGVRHYKSYPFQEDELSFTSLVIGIRRSL